jgi:hypothetical protein
VKYHHIRNIGKKLSCSRLLPPAFSYHTWMGIIAIKSLYSTIPTTGPLLVKFQKYHYRLFSDCFPALPRLELQGSKQMRSTIRFDCTVNLRFRTVGDRACTAMAASHDREWSAMPAHVVAKIFIVHAFLEEIAPKPTVSK